MYFLRCFVGIWEGVVVQLLSHVQLFATPCSTPGFSVLYLREFAQTHVHWVDDAIQPSHPLSSPSAFNLPSIRVFSNELVLCIRCSKYWSFSFSISPSNECSGLISFRMDWWHLLTVQGTLKSLQCHSLKTPVVQSFLWSSSHIHTWLLEKP